MSGQFLPKAFICYRIGDPAGGHPVYSSVGSILYPGRWNTAANSMIYASEHYSTAMLEKLAHGSGVMPPNQHYIEITIPANTSYEVFDHNSPKSKGWDDLVCSVSRSYGDDWAISQRSLLLLVPSVIARTEQNIIINDKHPHFHTIAGSGNISLHRPVTWDSRLFGP